MREHRCRSSNDGREDGDVASALCHLCAVSGILPANATLIAAIMLAQIPTLQDLAGIAFVIIAIAIHKPPGSAAEGQSLSDNAAPVREKVK